MRLLTLFCVGLICSCSGGSKNNGDEVTIMDWLSVDVSSYMFIYEATGFDPIRGKWEIQVVNDSVISVNLLDSNTMQEFSLSTDTAPTIMTLFEKISSCKATDSCMVVEETYDTNYYFPIKYRWSNPSEGGGFNVTDFSVQ